MQHALIVIVPPEATDDPRDEQVLRFLHLVRKVASSKTKTDHVAKVHPHVWQIPLQSDLAFLAECVSEYKDSGFACKVLLLDEEPKWIYCPEVS